MIEDILSELKKSKSDSEKKEYKEMTKENNFVVELIEGEMNASLPVFFADQSTMSAFIDEWVSAPEDGLILLKDVKLKEHIINGGSVDYYLKKSTFTGLKIENPKDEKQSESA